jgi:UDP-N-acetylglucosamine transferase subunit ALG13
VRSTDVPLRAFVTVGNATVPFDRLLSIVDEALGMVTRNVIGVCQTGVSRVRPRGLSIEPFLGRRDYEAEMARADVVVAHAGIGTLHAARRARHRPFVIPRRASLGEIVNDHQMEVYVALLRRGLIAPAETPASLASALVNHVRLGEAPSVSEADGLAIRSALENGRRRSSSIGRALVRAVGMGLPSGSLLYSAAPSAAGKGTPARRED